MRFLLVVIPLLAFAAADDVKLLERCGGKFCSFPKSQRASLEGHLIAVFAHSVRKMK